MQQQPVLTLKKETLAEFQAGLRSTDALRWMRIYSLRLYGRMESCQASAFHIETVDLLQNLSPWGQKFPQPIFDGVFKIMDYRWLKDVHLKLNV